MVAVVAVAAAAPVANGPGTAAATLDWPVTENKEEVKEGWKRKTKHYNRTRITILNKTYQQF